MLYCGKPPKEKYKKTGENIKKHDLFSEKNATARVSQLNDQLLR